MRYCVPPAGRSRARCVSSGCCYVGAAGYHTVFSPGFSVGDGADGVGGATLTTLMLLGILGWAGLFCKYWLPPGLLFPPQLLALGPGVVPSRDRRLYFDVAGLPSLYTCSGMSRCFELTFRPQLTSHDVPS